MALTGLTALGASPSGAATTALSAALKNPVWHVTLPDAGHPIAESSPNVATLDGGGPAVVVGDRAGKVYAYHLQGGSPVAGWPTQDGGAPIDATPSVATLGGSNLDSVFVGSGNATHPTVGGYQGYGPSGNGLWNAAVVDPASDTQPAQGVQASLAVGNLQGSTDVVAGSLDQEEYALNAGNGSTLKGWPFFTSDSVFSTAALADLYGTGQTEVVEGGDQTAGFGNGRTYTQGGHLRILNSQGGLICHYDTNQTVHSSPAVGGFLAGGATGIAVGTGSYFGGASDSDTLKAFNSDCGLQWSTTLPGYTTSSPALADLTDNGTLDVVEGVTTSSGQGAVSALTGTTGKALWTTPVPDAVLGSVVTFDMAATGHEDVLVPMYPTSGAPTAQGVDVLNGATGAVITSFATNLGFQNSPLVTDDPTGSIGITVAGYGGATDVGWIEHYVIPGTDGAAAVGNGAWPEFHHDPQLTGNAGGTPAAGSVPACSIPSGALQGYNLVASDGGVFSFGGAPFCGSTGGMTLNAPIVGMAMASNTGGYWFAASDGGVFAYGGAQFYGSMGGRPLNEPIVAIAATPDGQGYWLVASDGGIFAFGDAQFYGSMGGRPLNQPIVGLEPTTDGLGYRLVAADGGIFAFGPDAQFFGSMGGKPLVAPIVGLADDVATGGYWEVAADGGIFAFGATFFGSMGGKPLVAPIVGMAASLNGYGYRFVAADGGIFSFGDATFYGSMGGRPLNRPIVGLAGT
jgi:outer membrane protein assembly factor BamB